MKPSTKFPELCVEHHRRLYYHLLVLIVGYNELIKKFVLFCQAPGGHELHCDFWELIGLAPAGGADNLLNEESDVDVQLNNRHMMIRGENISKILRVRSIVMQCFRDHFFSRGYCEVIPKAMHMHTLSTGSLMDPKMKMIPK